MKLSLSRFQLYRKSVQKRLTRITLVVYVGNYRKPNHKCRDSCVLPFFESLLGKEEDDEFVVKTETDIKEWWINKIWYDPTDKI